VSEQVKRRGYQIVFEAGDTRAGCIDGAIRELVANRIRKDENPALVIMNLGEHVTGEVITGGGKATERTVRTCNRHIDCDIADEEAAKRGKRTDHCHDECCEDCFGC
jgi:hypothetical protein